MEKSLIGQAPRSSTTNEIDPMARQAALVLAGMLLGGYEIREGGAEAHDDAGRTAAEPGKAERNAKLRPDLARAGNPSAPASREAPPR